MAAWIFISHDLFTERLKSAVAVSHPLDLPC